MLSSNSNLSIEPPATNAHQQKRIYDNIVSVSFKVSVLKDSLQRNIPDQVRNKTNLELIEFQESMERLMKQYTTLKKKSEWARIQRSFYYYFFI